MYIIIGILIIYVFITLVAFPFQYRYIIALEEMKQKNKNKTQGQMYDSMNFDELVLHNNAQGNFFFIPANFLAKWVYKKRHQKG